jgi:5-(carboxyamino)imidazole ribonucleotide mutase
LANHDAALASKLAEFRTKQAAKVHAIELSDKP